MIKKYRPKNICEVIEWTGGNLDEIKDFLGDCFVSKRFDNSIIFKTYKACKGKLCCDYYSVIIKTIGHDNQYYYSCCQKELFFKNNELVEDLEIIEKLKNKIDSILKDNHFLHKKFDNFKDKTHQALVEGLYMIFYDIEGKKYTPKSTSFQPPWDRYNYDARFKYIVNALTKHVFTSIYVCPPPHPSLEIDLSASIVPEEIKGKNKNVS